MTFKLYSLVLCWVFPWQSFRNSEHFVRKCAALYSEKTNG